MKQCKLCGKKGLFLKLTFDGVCPDCIRLNEINLQLKKNEEKLKDLQNEIQTAENEIKDRNQKIDEIRNNKNEIIFGYRKELLSKYEDEILAQQKELCKVLDLIKEKEEYSFEVNENIKKNEKQIESLTKKIIKAKSINDSIIYCNKNMESLSEDACKILTEEFSPVVEIKLHYMDVKELRTKYNENKKQIKELLEKYESRYTTKANKTIYKLMVYALESEIQNILFDLRYGKLEEGKEKVLTMTRRYLSIASEGNQNILNTVTTFIGQIEYFYLKAVEIEYEYYTKKEKIKEEQRALREQLRQEAIERKILEEQKVQIEKEESKYITEINAIKENVDYVTDEKRKILEDRVKELEGLLEQVKGKKDEIINLQNGKAGYVYVISNLGSFGDDVFKIGMTRRLDPQDRVNELGSASVPFPFDVHSFIFSEDAVELEHNLHIALNKKRVNKVNLRKEFFKVSLEELENIVFNFCPSAEFRRTMLAEQFRQSLSAGDNEFIYDVEEEIFEEIEEEEVLI